MRRSLTQPTLSLDLPPRIPVITASSGGIVVVIALLVPVMLLLLMLALDVFEDFLFSPSPALLPDDKPPEHADGHDHV